MDEIDPQERLETIKSVYFAKYPGGFNYFAVADKLTPGSDLEKQMLAVLEGKRKPITNKEIGLPDKVPNDVLI